jgi:hypothetical protein
MRIEFDQSGEGGDEWHQQRDLKGDLRHPPPGPVRRSGLRSRMRNYVFPLPDAERPGRSARSSGTALCPPNRNEPDRWPRHSCGRQR